MSKIKHESTLEIFNIMFKNNIVASYVGPFDSDILTLLAENLEATLWQNETIRRKFFKIFVELAQNIALYSNERSVTKGKEYGEGTLIISDYGDHFLFTAGNIVNPQVKKLLAKRTKTINSLDRMGLRALKRKLRNRGNKKGGGNIGLVQVALLAKNPLEVNFFPTEKKDMSFYLVSIKIEKE